MHFPLYYYDARTTIFVPLSVNVHSHLYHRTLYQIAQERRPGRRQLRVATSRCVRRGIRLLPPDEVAVVQAALNRHPQGRYYRVRVRANWIEVYEPAGMTPEQLIAELRWQGVAVGALTGAPQAHLDRTMQFTPVMRFILADAESRRFRVERMCYLSSFEGWRDIHRLEQLQPLARELIPTLGTDAFFEL